MPPPTMQQRYAGTQNNPPSHHQYPAYSQPSLPPPSLASAGYMNGPSMNQNPFANGSNSLNIGGNFGRPGPGMPGDTGLGSQHVMNSFAAAGIHQQNGLVDSGGRGAMNNKHRVRDVWASNLQEEIAVIRQLADDFPFIATVRISTRASAGAILTWFRTPSSLGWWHVPWALLMGRVTTIISACDAMSIYSR